MALVSPHTPYHMQPPAMGYPHAMGHAAHTPQQHTHTPQHAQMHMVAPQMQMTARAYTHARTPPSTGGYPAQPSPAATPSLVPPECASIHTVMAQHASALYHPASGAAHRRFPLAAMDQALGAGRGTLYDMCRTQAGSRMLQQWLFINKPKASAATPAQDATKRVFTFGLKSEPERSLFLTQSTDTVDTDYVAYVALHLLSHAPEAMVALFGNYFLQRFLYVASRADRFRLLLALQEYLPSVAADKQGTRTVQKLIEVCDCDEERVLLLAALRGEVPFRCASAPASLFAQAQTYFSDAPAPARNHCACPCVCSCPEDASADALLAFPAYARVAVPSDEARARPAPFDNGLWFRFSAASSRLRLAVLSHVLTHAPAPGPAGQDLLSRLLTALANTSAPAHATLVAQIDAHGVTLHQAHASAAPAPVPVLLDALCLPPGVPSVHSLTGSHAHTVVPASLVLCPLARYALASARPWIPVGVATQRLALASALLFPVPQWLAGQPSMTDQPYEPIPTAAPPALPLAPFTAVDPASINWQHPDLHAYKAISLADMPPLALTAATQRRHACHARAAQPPVRCGCAASKSKGDCKCIVNGWAWRLRNCQFPAPYHANATKGVPELMPPPATCVCPLPGFLPTEGGPHVPYPCRCLAARMAALHTDTNAVHVVCAALDCMPMPLLLASGFPYAAIAHLPALASNSHGVVALKKLLSVLPPCQFVFWAERLAASPPLLVRLCVDPFGNYLVQHVIDRLCTDEAAFGGLHVTLNSTPDTRRHAASPATPLSPSHSHAGSMAQADAALQSTLVPALHRPVSAATVLRVVRMEALEEPLRSLYTHLLHLVVAVVSSALARIAVTRSGSTVVEKLLRACGKDDRRYLLSLLTGSNRSVSAYALSSEEGVADADAGASLLARVVGDGFGAFILQNAYKHLTTRERLLVQNAVSTGNIKKPVRKRWEAVFLDDRHHDKKEKDSIAEKLDAPAPPASAPAPVASPVVEKEREGRRGGDRRREGRDGHGSARRGGREAGKPRE
jgi:hypothetical protein